MEKLIVSHFDTMFSALAAKQNTCANEISDTEATKKTVKGPDGAEDVIPCRTRIWAAGVQGSPLARIWPRCASSAKR